MSYCAAEGVGHIGARAAAHHGRAAAQRALRGRRFVMDNHGAVAAIKTAGRFMLPEFAGQTYQVVWWFMAGLYIVTAVIVTLLGGAKRLATSIPPGSTDERDSTGER